MVLMLIKYWSLKKYDKNSMVIIIHLNTLLDLMIMILLDHYYKNFLKRLATLIYLKIKKQK